MSKYRSQVFRAKSGARRAAYRRHILTSLFFVIALVYIGFPEQLRSAVYTPPSGAPPSGDLGLPLNISSSYQVKDGDLTLGNGLQILSSTGIPTLEVNGRINWFGDLQTDWPSAIVPGVDLVKITPTVPPEQTGWMHVVGTNNPTLGQEQALLVISPKPTIAAPTYGVWGIASPNIGGSSSYGVYAQAGSNSNQNFALHGNAPAMTSWGGYFAGNVAIMPPFDLVVGNGVLLEGLNPGTGEICLNDICRSTWPTASDLYWTDAGTSIEAVNSSWNMAAGGSDAAAQFFAEKIPSGNMVIKSNGTGSSNVLVVQ